MIAALEAEVKKKDGQIKQRDQMLDAMKAQFDTQAQQIKEIQEYKEIMMLAVDTTGVPGDKIQDTLDSAVKMLESRLEGLGLKDKYQILAYPKTLGIGIIR